MRLWARLQAQAFAAATKRLAAQPLATALAVLVIAIAIALPILSAVVVKSLGAATARFDTDPHVTAYLALDATDAEAKEVEAALRKHPDIATVRFIPRDRAFEEMKASTHLAELLATLDRNPLPHAFTVSARVAESERILALRDTLRTLPKVDQVVADIEWSEKLGHWVRFADRALFGVAAFLALAVVFIVGHLIRLQVLMYRDEIEVSQLIGATAADVRRPFLYHGVFQGLLAAGAALLIAGGITLWLNVELQALTSSYTTEFKIVFLDTATLLGILAGAILLGLLGAWLSVSRELRRFSRPA